MRVIRQTDEAANDDGYDSQGLRAPWEGCQELDFDGTEAMEEPLPVGPPPSLPPLPSPENFAQKTSTFLPTPIRRFRPNPSRFLVSTIYSIPKFLQKHHAISWKAHLIGNSTEYGGRRVEMRERRYVMWEYWMRSVLGVHAVVKNSVQQG